jgi:hypothetical protein
VPAAANQMQQQQQQQQHQQQTRIDCSMLLTSMPGF